MGVHQEGSEKLLYDGLAECNRNISGNRTALVFKPRRGLCLSPCDVHRLYNRRDIASYHPDCLAQTQEAEQ